MMNEFWRIACWFALSIQTRHSCCFAAVVKSVHERVLTILDPKSTMISWYEERVIWLIVCSIVVSWSTNRESRIRLVHLITGRWRLATKCPSLSSSNVRWIIWTGVGFEFFLVPSSAAKWPLTCLSGKWGEGGTRSRLRCLSNDSNPSCRLSLFLRRHEELSMLPFSIISRWSWLTVAVVTAVGKL